MDARVGPVLFPAIEIALAPPRGSRSACPLSGVRWAWPTPDSTFPFAIGIADPARQRDHAVVREHVAIERIEGGIVDVGLEHALLQIVEHDDLGHPPSRRKAFSCSSAQIRVLDRQHQQAHRLAAIAERQDEEPRAASTCRSLGHAPSGPPVVDLRLFAGCREDDARRRDVARPRSLRTKRLTPHSRRETVVRSRSCQIAMALRAATERQVDCSRYGSQALGGGLASWAARLARRRKVGGHLYGRFCRRAAPLPGTHISTPAGVNTHAPFPCAHRWLPQCAVKTIRASPMRLLAVFCRRSRRCSCRGSLQRLLSESTSWTFLWPVFRRPYRAGFG